MPPKRSTKSVAETTKENTTTINERFAALPTDILLVILQQGSRDMVARLKEQLEKTIEEKGTVNLDQNRFLTSFRSVVDFLCNVVSLDCETRRAFTSGKDVFVDEWKTLLHLLITCYEARPVVGKDVSSAFRYADAACSYKRAVLLLTRSGCQICDGKPRTRKVHWEMMDGRGVRCCQECLEEWTVSDYRLVNDFALVHEINDEALQQLLNDMPHSKTQLYAPHFGSYTLRFYWIPSVLVRLGLVADITAADVMTLQEAVEILGTFRRRRDQLRIDNEHAIALVHTERVRTLCDGVIEALTNAIDSEEAAIHRAVAHIHMFDSYSSSFPGTAEQLAARSSSFRHVLHSKPSHTTISDLNILVRTTLKEALISTFERCLLEQCRAFVTSSFSINCYTQPLVEWIKSFVTPVTMFTCNKIMRKTKGLRTERHPVNDPEWFHEHIAPKLTKLVEDHEQAVVTTRERERKEEEERVADC